MSSSSDVRLSGDSVTPHLFPDAAAIADTAEIFGLLSDPGRLRLLAVLLEAEASVGASKARVLVVARATRT